MIFEVGDLVLLDSKREGITNLNAVRHGYGIVMERFEWKGKHVLRVAWLAWISLTDEYKTPNIMYYEESHTHATPKVISKFNELKSRHIRIDVAV